ncbi:hypothetical protein AABM27_12325, partial [Heyndrickxia faecalis]|uniref:hypothetical protein n=1 Tax=Heyndrickxia faecalis TaxID=2824910 RepID=UPI003100FC8A
IITYLAAFLGGIFKLSRKIFTPQSWAFKRRKADNIRPKVHAEGFYISRCTWPERNGICPV